MASKIQKLKRWLCCILGCEPAPAVVTRVSAGFDRIHLDGYDIEVYLTDETIGLVVNVLVYLKGEEVLEGLFVAPNLWEWVGCVALSAPTYKTRKYIRDYALTKLAKEQQ